ncbi:hypothetical protein DC430_13725 [Rhizobium rhizogenes]|uniref:Uncharacterized protein n=1 Tax=Rhizobium rhizogenes TaxID=359 RepID=A0AA92H9B8_RHIRH|nr:hypothetical protein DC430_13725 [Rhizobium rhizogenes]
MILVASSAFTSSEVKLAIVDVESFEICVADKDEIMEVMNVSLTEWRLVAPICRLTLSPPTAIRHAQIKRNC